MPFSLSIQPIIDAQTTAINNAINAARDNVKADSTTKTTSITNAINAARDDVKADNVTKISDQTASIQTALNTTRDAVNTNTNTKTGELTTAVNAKGVVKSIQRGTVGPNDDSGYNRVAMQTVTVATVNPAKAALVINGAINNGTFNGNTVAGGTGRLINANQIELRGWIVGASYQTTTINWELIEYF